MATNSYGREKREKKKSFALHVPEVQLFEKVRNFSSSSQIVYLHKEVFGILFFHSF